jgi:fatty-acyl-CoA synthase
MKSEIQWYRGTVVGEVLRNQAKRFPGQTAFISPEASVRMSYMQLDSAVDQVAKSLLAWDINKGDHVAVMTPDIPEWILLQMATARIGAIMIPVNPNLSEEFLFDVLNRSDVKSLFIVDKFEAGELLRKFLKICPELTGSVLGELECAKLPLLKVIVCMRRTPVMDVIHWQEFFDSGKVITNSVLRNAESKVVETDVMVIHYTSLSTGIAKPALLTQRAVLLNALYTTERQKITYKDKICLAAPFHSYFSGTLCGLVQGATIINPSDIFDAGSILNVIEKEEATAIIGFPKMFAQILDKWNKVSYMSTSLRTGMVIGDLPPTRLIRSIINDLGIKGITVSYGLTEASQVITQTFPDDSDDIKFDTVGKALPGAEVKIVDLVNGKTLSWGNVGELCTRGNMVMLGYYKHESGDTFIDNEGWLHTGDLAMQREDGNYKIIGRISDIIKNKGEIIFPLEIEKILFTHPDVEDVVVVGVPDISQKGRICAVIKLTPGSKLSKEDIMEFCKAKMAAYKVPHDILFIDKFPMTVIGKIQKFKVKEWALKKLGLKN